MDLATGIVIAAVLLCIVILFNNGVFSNDTRYDTRYNMRYETPYDDSVQEMPVYRAPPQPRMPPPANEKPESRQEPDHPPEEGADTTNVIVLPPYYNPYYGASLYSPYRPALGYSSWVYPTQPYPYAPRPVFWGRNYWRHF